MAATFLRLGYGTPASGVYPNHVNFAYPVWQKKDGAGYLVRTGRRMSKTPVAKGTLVQGLGRNANEHDIQLLYRPRLRPHSIGVTPPPWYSILDTIEDELLKQECGLYWGDIFRGRFLVSDFTWATRNDGYPPDTNTTYGGWFGREVDVDLKLTKVLDE